MDKLREKQRADTADGYRQCEKRGETGMIGKGESTGRRGERREWVIWRPHQHNRGEQGNYGMDKQRRWVKGGLMRGKGGNE